MKVVKLKIAKFENSEHEDEERSNLRLVNRTSRTKEECNRHGLSYSTKPEVEKGIRVAKRFNFAGRNGAAHYRARFN